MWAAGSSSNIHEERRQILGEIRPLVLAHWSIRQWRFVLRRGDGIVASKGAGSPVSFTITLRQGRAIRNVLAFGRRQNREQACHRTRSSGPMTALDPAARGATPGPKITPTHCNAVKSRGGNRAKWRGRLRGCGADGPIWRKLPAADKPRRGRRPCASEIVTASGF